MSRFRRRLMGLAALGQAAADDFVRVEYIENTSNAYIDTKLFTVYNDGRTYKHIVNLSYTVTNERQLNGANGNGFFGIDKNGKFECAYIQDSAIAAGDSWHNINFSYVSPTNTRKINIKYEIDNQLLEKNLSKVTLYNYPYAIFIFAIGGINDAAPSFFCKERIKSYQIYIDDVLVRDYIPMYQISTDTYGLWDRVTKEFYTSPNGVKFIGGHQIIYDAEIEYLESTGSQYIKTGIIPTSEFSFEITADILGNYEWNPIGVWDNWLKDMFGVDLKFSKKGGILNCWGNTYTENKVRPINTWLKISQKNGEQIISRLSDGYIYFNSTLKNTFNCSTDIYIFALNLNNHATYQNNGRISSVIIRNNNKTLLDLIPVRVGNVGYMYDKVSNKLFGNNGSGSFILGQDTIVYDKI